MHENGELEEKTSKLFTLFLEKIGGTNLASFQGVCMNDVPIVEDLVEPNIFLYGEDFVDGAMNGEFVGRSIGEHFNAVRLLRYNSHICYVSNINALFEAYRCPSSDQFIFKAGNLESYLTTCKDGAKHIFPKNVNQLRETLFDKLDSFGIPYTSNQKLFNKLIFFDFELLCVEVENFRDTETTTWIGKHVPISVSISPNLIQEPISLCDPIPLDLVSSFNDTLEILATQSKALNKMNFFQIKTAKNRLARILETLNQRRSH